MPYLLDNAPGAPGIEPRWTSSAKTGVGTALSTTSPVWFTISHGILNEVYFPRVDSACIRDMELIVTGPEGYFSEEKRDCISETRMTEAGIPTFRIVNSSRDEFYRIEKLIFADPARAVVLQRITFVPLVGRPSDFHVHALLAPHLGNGGMGNSAWIGGPDDAKVLLATARGQYLALAASLPWRAASAGYVGQSDGYQQLRTCGGLTPRYQRADDGNVALCGEIGFDAENPTVVLALGFGHSETEAATVAAKSLWAGFKPALEAYRKGWAGWQGRLRHLDGREAAGNTAYRVSTAVLASHRAADRPGAVVASLSIPWGASKGDGDLGGYHLVWPRDLVEAAGGFLAAGDAKEALAILDYLREVQLASGRWSQNLWLDGRPYWNGVQMDECAFPILLVDLLSRKTVLSRRRMAPYLPMVRKAAGYILAHGPATPQDRWEENGGYSPFTLAVEIAALLAAADLLEAAGDPDAAMLLRDTADSWNDQIEDWTFATSPAICEPAGVFGYYARNAPDGPTDSAAIGDAKTPIRNRGCDLSALPARDVLSPDALALVRFGLRAADDPRIIETVKALDHHLRIELPQGPLWYRYTGDGYGEHADGAPFDGAGIGRPWPLLTGERAHYELAAGRPAEAEALLATMEASAGDGGLLPEQVWDGDDLPERELWRGRPSGGAMPLVWAHAEHIKLRRSLADGAVFDMPRQGVERYQKNQAPPRLRIWRPDNRIRRIDHGLDLRLILSRPALVHWSTDGWVAPRDLETRRSSLGVHVADLGIAALEAGSVVRFTFLWRDTGQWENLDYDVSVTARP